MTFSNKLICLFLVLLIVCPGSAVQTVKAEYSPKVVKIGIPDVTCFSKKQENGSYRGILIDYLQEIAKYAGWKLDYVEGSVQQLIEKLDQGEIDIMGLMIKNETSLQQYDFADYSSGYSYTTLNIRSDDKRYRPMDYTSFSGMRVGIFKKALNRIPAFFAFMESNNLDLDPIYYDNSAQLLEALEKGEVDAILTNDISESTNQKSIAKFGAIPYYFAVTKGKSDILRQLNSALATILEINPKFDDIVYEKHINSKDLIFAPNNLEEDFIQNSGTIKAVMVSNLAPIEYYDNANKRMDGISPDVIRQIAAQTGLNFEMLRADSLAEAREMLLAGEADLLTGLYDNAIDKDEMGIVFTIPYLNIQSVTARNFSPKPSAFGVAAMPTGYVCALTDPSSKIVYYDSMEDCIQAVMTGNANFTIFNNLVIDHYTYLRGNQHVSLTPSANIVDGLRFGLSDSTDPTLLSILDKAIYSIHADEIQSIMYKNTTTQNVDITLSSLMYNYPTTFVMIACIIILIFMITAVLLLLFMRTRLKLAQQAALRGESYQIIGDLTDEYIFSYEFASQELVLPEAFARIIKQKSKLSFKEIMEGNNSQIKEILSTFDTRQETNSTTVEFKCVQEGEKDRWFKAIGTIVFDAEKKPVRGLGKITNIQKEKQEKLILENLANIDSLTGLLSRQRFEQLVVDVLRQDKGKKQGALMVLDLDHFKTINDTLGHLAGDKILQEFAKILNSAFKEEDIVGRWGGDEFTTYIRNAVNEQEISACAEHLCRIMNREFCYEGKSHLLSISVGISLTGKDSSYTQLFENADAALYEVKKNQRNGFKIN